MPISTRSRWQQRGGVFASVLLFALVMLAHISVQDARANGRFPATNQLHIADTPGGGRSLLMRTTFGVLLSRDEGANWDWVCERAMGYQAVPQDPPFAISANGSIFAGTFGGLRISSNAGCDFRTPAGSLGSSNVVDLTVAGFDRNQAFFLTNQYARKAEDGAFLYDSQLFATDNNGATFNARGASLDPTLVFHTLDATTSDPARLYLSATRATIAGPRGVMLTSRDGGATYEEFPIPLATGETAVFIAAVDPVQPARVYLRTAGNIDTDGRVLLSKDSGATYKEILKLVGAIRGFALSPSGDTVWAGGQTAGLYRAPANTLAFSKVASTQIQCLFASRNELWACSNEASGFIAGRSTDGGATFTPVLRLAGIRGPLSCAAGSATAACGAEWPTLSAELGIRGPADAGAAVDAGNAPVAPAANASSGCCATAHVGEQADRAGSAFALGSCAMFGLLIRRRRGARCTPNLHAN